MHIRFEDVSVEFDNHTALYPLSLLLSEKRVGVIGLNGSGKSTFARLIAGLVKPTAGRVLLDELNVIQNAKILRPRIGYIFQNPANQIIMPVVQDDMEFGLRAREPNKAMRLKACIETLKRLEAEDLASRRAHELSGGELQLAALASVLVLQPEFVIFDEPTNQLDLINRRRVKHVIENLSQQAIIISHDLPLVEDYDRVLVFHKGRLVADELPAKAISKYLEITR